MFFCFCFFWEGGFSKGWGANLKVGFVGGRNSVAGAADYQDTRWEHQGRTKDNAPCPLATCLVRTTSIKQQKYPTHLGRGQNFILTVYKGYFDSPTKNGGVLFRGGADLGVLEGPVVTKLRLKCPTLSEGVGGHENNVGMTLSVAHFELCVTPNMIPSFLSQTLFWPLYRLLRLSFVHHFIDIVENQESLVNCR